MTESHAVFDASVFVRALVDESPDAVEWVRRAVRGEVSVSVPSLVYFEVANALVLYVRGGGLSVAGAVRRIELARNVPRYVRDDAELAAAALGAAVERGLSAYDAAYAVLAEAENVPLVTADRDLARLTKRAEVLT